MPGFPIGALGAGLGLFAKQYQEQQAAAERNKMLQMQLAMFQQQMQDRQGQNELSNLDLSGVGAPTVQPTPGGASAVPPIGGGMPFAPSMPKAQPNYGAAGEYGGGQLGFSSGLQKLISLGVAPDAAEGAISYMQRNESKGPLDTNPKSGAFGRAQWLGPRKRALVGQYGQSPTDEQQADFMGSELQGLEGNTLAQLRSAKTRQEGYDIWGRSYERPGDEALAQAGVGRGGGAGGQQMVQAGPQTATDAGPQDDLQAQIAQIPLPSPPDLHLDEVRRRINATGARWEDKERMLQNYIAQRGPQAKAAYDQAMEQYKTQVGVVTEQFQHARNRREKLSDEERAPGPLIQRGDQTYVVNPRKRTATPVIDETTGQPLTDAQRLGGGGSGSASAGREKDIVTEIKRLDDEYAEANPNATKAERDSAHFANRKRAEKELTAAKTSETRSTLANIAMRKLRDEHPEWDGKDLLRESSKIIAQQTTDRNFAGGTGATQMRSLNTVADHLKLMQEYSKALRDGSMPFTDIPRLNQIIQFLAKERGMPEVTNFNVARDIMADEVVRLLTSTGGTEADRAGMQSRLAAAMSEYQQTGALTAFEKFTAGRFKGLEQGYARNDPERIKDFRDNMMTPEARAIFTKGEGAGAAETAGGPPSEAVQMLRNDKSPDAQKNFDAIFGAGAAAKALGGGAVPAATPGAL
jgi:hypothetical protein